ncbi:MAG: FAD-dependent oxidoreductase [Thermoanaerobaculia bacterium]
MRALVPPRSTASRDRDFEGLGSESWDLLVIGGGITGTAVARDAALRGLRTALVEQGDFAFGTSSRSSRLVHGGLRYLADFDFSLVREGLVERKRLLEAAPGLVRPVRFTYPVYRGDPDGLWKVHLGVRLYDALSFGYGLGDTEKLNRDRLLASVPGLRRDGLVGAVTYFDAATHDTRLTLAVARSARDAGALLVPRCRALGLTGDSESSQGAEIADLLGDRRVQVRAKATALCCGPWQTLYPPATVELRTARGTHISLKNRRIPLDGYIALRSPRDGRFAFAMPIGRYIVFGTTDTDDRVEPGLVRPSAEDTEYLLELANHAFPAVDVTADDVTGAWAGLRPLVAESGEEDADALSRRHQIVPGPPGLWILTGGKLTTHRRMAEDLVDEIAPFLERAGVAVGDCRTQEGRFSSASLESGGHRLAAVGVSEAAIDSAAGLYGPMIEELSVRVQTPEGAEPDAALRRAQIAMAVEDEWALSLDDLLLRRLEPGPLDLKACWSEAPAAAHELGSRLGWTDDEIRHQAAELRGGIERDLEAADVPLPRSTHE